MDVTYLHGPDRTPLRIDADGTVVSPRGTPFHGIVSRGLLEWLQDRPEGAALWERLAHRLHDGSDADEPALDELRAAAERQRVLSLSQSAAAARRYIAEHRAEHVAACELWNIKEGHTSSVWVVTLAPGGRRFVVNVARDAQAGEELRATSERMRDLRARHVGVRIAAVLEIATVELAAIDGPVTVVCNELVSDALEVHRVNGRLAVVERFLTSADAPGRISAVRGRLLSDAERTTIEAAVERLHAAAEPAAPLSVDINHGDVVWDGNGPVVVALS